MTIKRGGKQRYCLNCQKEVEDIPCPYCGNPILIIKREKKYKKKTRKISKFSKIMEDLMAWSISKSFTRDGKVYEKKYENTH